MIGCFFFCWDSIVATLDTARHCGSAWILFVYCWMCVPWQCLKPVISLIRSNAGARWECWEDCHLLASKIIVTQFGLLVIFFHISEKLSRTAQRLSHCFPLWTKSIFWYIWSVFGLQQSVRRMAFRMNHLLGEKIKGCPWWMSLSSRFVGPC